jgi:hypothetical protein
MLFEISYKSPKTRLSKEQLFEWRLIHVRFNSYGMPIEKWVSCKSRWSAVIIFNCENPMFSIYDERNNYIGALKDLP